MMVWKVCDKSAWLNFTNTHLNTESMATAKLYSKRKKEILAFQFGTRLKIDIKLVQQHISSFNLWYSAPQPCYRCQISLWANINAMPASTCRVKESDCQNK